MVKRSLAVLSALVAGECLPACPFAPEPPRHWVLFAAVAALGGAVAMSLLVADFVRLPGRQVALMQRRGARASTPNQALQQTGAACRLSGIHCFLSGPGC